MDTGQLARVEYERALHVLHEMKLLGASIEDDGRGLTDSEIDWLESADAERVLLRMKQKLGKDGIISLYHDVLADSDRRWRMWACSYDPSHAHTGVTEIAIRGISVAETVSVLGDACGPITVFRTFAEHLLGEGSIATGQFIIEIFALLGEPTCTHGVASRGAIPEGIPVVRDPSYPACPIGKTMLARTTRTSMSEQSTRFVRLQMTSFPSPPSSARAQRRALLPKGISSISLSSSPTLQRSPMRRQQGSAANRGMPLHAGLPDPVFGNANRCNLAA